MRDAHFDRMSFKNQNSASFVIHGVTQAAQAKAGTLMLT